MISIARLLSVPFLCLSSLLPLAAEETVKFTQDFEEAEAGSLPDGMMEIEGAFTVEALDGRKALKLAEAPLAEDAVILGPSFKGAGSVMASVKADKKRRSFPRFGVGLHGISGYRLRVVGASGMVELVKNEEVVKAVAFAWKSELWTTLKLELREADGKWIVEGRVWAEGTEAPGEPTIALETDKEPGQGKASLWGTPYAGLPIWFDSVEITSPAQAEEKKASE